MVRMTTPYCLLLAVRSFILPPELLLLLKLKFSVQAAGTIKYRAMSTEYRVREPYTVNS